MVPVPMVPVPLWFRHTQTWTPHQIVLTDGWIADTLNVALDVAVADQAMFRGSVLIVPIVASCV
jgi:hypothetical protein